MSSEPCAICVEGVGKTYPLYAHASDRLKQFLLPRLQRWTGRPVRQYHQRVDALADVSLTVARGETVGVIGRNGSGKSTLLQLVCGTLQPTQGHVETHGRVAALLELGTGFNPEFSGRENVFLNAALLGLAQEQTAERFEAIAQFAGIGDFMDRPVKTYSSGMLVRLAFAVVAHVDADILVIDEALAVGDAYFTRKCMRFLRDFMKHGTVLFVSHDIASVKALCERVIWIDQGRLVADGPTRDVCTTYLEATFAQEQGMAGGPPPARPRSAAAPARDQRLAFLNASNLRNDLQVFSFDPDAHGFGLGGARIIHVALLDTAGEPLAWVVGGEAVTLAIAAEALSPLDRPILGFMVKDRLGQPLFGDNTHLSYCDTPVHAAPGEHLTACFTFDMPILPAGDYTILVAIADGTQAENVHHHWIHDAVRFRCESSSVATGLVGIPMRKVTLAAAAADDTAESGAT